MTEQALPPRGLGSLTLSGLIALMMLVLSQFFWTRTLGLPSVLNWLDDLTVLALGVLALTRPPPRVRLPHGWALLLVAFLSVAVLGTFANGVPLWRAALGIRGVLLYLGLYYAVVTSPLTRDDGRRILGVLFAIMLLQLPLQLGQFAVGVARFGADWNVLADVAVGSFGSGMANALGLLTLPFITTAILLWMQTRNPLWLVATGILVLELVLSSGRAALLLMFPSVLGGAFLMYGWRSMMAPRRLAALALAAVLAVAAAEAYYRATSGGGLAARFSPTLLLREQLTYNPAGSSRLLYYPVTWDVLVNHAASPLIGMGPGNYASGAGYLTNAPGLNLIRDVFGQWRTGRETALNSQLLASAGEFGLVGVSLFGLMVLALARRTLLVRQQQADPKWRVVLTGIFVGQMLFVVATPLQSLWEDQVVSFPFWLVTGLVTRLAAEAGRLEPRASAELPVAAGQLPAHE